MYLGNQPADSYLSLEKQTFTTSATASYTLTNAVSNANEIALFLNNVRQEPTEAYTVSGTALTLSTAITSGDTMYCIYLGKSIGTINPADGSVGSAQLVDGAVTSAKLASGVGGKVLQVVTGTYATQATTSSTTFTDSGLSVSITPSSASNKILIIVSNGIGTNNSAGVCHATIDRSGTNLGNSTNGMLASYSTAGQVFSNGSFSKLDSPNTTSSITYKYQFRIGNASYIAYAQFSDILASITALEIAG